MMVYDGEPRPVTEPMAEFPASCGEYAWAALPATIELFKAARGRKVPIVHVNYDTRAETDPRNIHPTNRKKRQSNLGLYTIKEELEPVEGELVVYKKRASAFVGTPLCSFLADLEAHLTRSRANGVILCGAPMSGAVRATAVESKSFGYKTAVAEDAAGDEATLLHKIALFDVAHKYADVVTV